MHKLFSVKCAFVMAATFVSLLPICAQSAKIQWASESDSTVKMMVEAERKWAVSECEPSDVENEYLADDFVGTAPSGSRYTKADVLADPQRGTVTARACQLLSAKVRFIGDNVAIIYGSETSIRKDKNSKEHDQTLIWTDTWMKRNGKWQIIAVQDMQAPKP